MTTIIEAKRKMREIGIKAQAVADNPDLTPAEQMKQLDSFKNEMEALQEVVSVHEQTKRFIAGGGALDGDPGAFQKSFTSGRIPRFGLDGGTAKALHDAAVHKSAIRLDLSMKSPMAPAAQLAPQMLPGLVSLAHEPARVLDHIPASSMAGPSIEFISHTSTTGGAGMVAAGTAKPEATLVTAQTILTARKIAVVASVVDESIADFAGFAGYVGTELQRLIVDVENDQVLNGSGTGENLLGLLKQTGILTRAKGTDTALDAMEQAITDLRSGPAFCDADTIVLHPTTWSSMRRSKDTQGRYLLNADPSASEANSLWGIPVVVTTQIAAGTALVANLEQGAQAFQRQGFTIETTNSATIGGADAFTSNLTVFRAEQRLALGSQRPAALCKVTGL